MRVQLQRFKPCAGLVLLLALPSAPPFATATMPPSRLRISKAQCRTQKLATTIVVVLQSAPRRSVRVCSSRGAEACACSHTHGLHAWCSLFAHNNTRATKLCRFKRIATACNAAQQRVACIASRRARWLMSLQLCAKEIKQEALPGCAESSGTQQDMQPSTRRSTPCHMLCLLLLAPSPSRAAGRARGRGRRRAHLHVREAYWQL